MLLSQYSQKRHTLLIQKSVGFIEKPACPCIPNVYNKKCMKLIFFAVTLILLMFNVSFLNIFQQHDAIKLPIQNNCLAKKQNNGNCLSAGNTGFPKNVAKRTPTTIRTNVEFEKCHFWSFCDIIYHDTRSTCVDNDINCSRD